MPPKEKGPSAKERKRLAKIQEQKVKESKQHVETGMGFMEKSKYQQAIQSFTQAIEVNPENTDAYLQRGRAEKESKEYEKAIADFTKALELDQTEASAYSGRGNAYECIQGLPNLLSISTCMSRARRSHAKFLCGVERPLHGTYVCRL